jgi:drug/metabolite transporter (DMT)-like permease
VALGAIFLDELITSAYAIGGLIILVGVILVVSVERIKKEPAV